MSISIYNVGFYTIRRHRHVHYGPSHATTGYFRVDEVKLNAIAGENNTLLVETAGYNCQP